VNEKQKSKNKARVAGTPTQNHKEDLRDEDRKNPIIRERGRTLVGRYDQRQKTPKIAGEVDDKEEGDPHRDRRDKREVKGSPFRQLGGV